MSTQIEILLKARDEATKQIQTAFKNAEQSLTQFNTVAGQTGKTLQKAGKDVSGFNQYMREGRTENRQFGFVMREVMDIVGGAALMIKLFGGNSSDSEKQAKRLSEAVMAGYIAFQFTETVIGLAKIGLTAYRSASIATKVALDAQTTSQVAANIASSVNPYVIIAMALVTLAAVTYSWVSSMESADKVQEELDKKVKDFNATIMSNGQQVQSLRNELGILSNEGYKEYLKSVVSATNTALGLARAELESSKERKDGIEIIKQFEVALSEAAVKNLQAKKTVIEFDKKLNKSSEETAKKELEIAESKNKALIDLQKSFVNKTKEIQETIGFTGVELKRKQLVLEAESLRETLDKQHNDRTKNNALYKQALDDLGVYVATKGQQITDEDNKQNEAKINNLSLAASAKKQVEFEANEQKKIAYEYSLMNELDLLNQQYDEIENLYNKQTEKDAVNSQRRIAIAELEAKKKQALVQQVADFSLQGLSLVLQFANQSSQAEILNIEKRRDSQLVAINDELAMEGLAEERRAELLVQKGILQAEADDRISAAKKEQFENQKAASIIEAIINTAVALTKTLAYPWMYPMIAALGAAQVALIYSQPTPEFHKGGSAFVNAPASQEGFLPIKVRGQETVRVNTESQEASRGGGITINFNSPVSDTQFITNSIKKVLNQTGLDVTSAFVNNRNKLELN